MTGPLDDVPVRDNAAAHRYEARVDGHVAIIAYAREANRIVFLHTIVPPALEGHGLASRMARVALDDAREQHLAVIPRCPFVASYIRRHPDYLSLVPEEERALVATAGAEQSHRTPRQAAQVILDVRSVEHRTTLAGCEGQTVTA